MKQFLSEKKRALGAKGYRIFNSVIPQNVSVFEKEVYTRIRAGHVRWNDRLNSFRIVRHPVKHKLYLYATAFYTNSKLTALTI